MKQENLLDVGVTSIATDPAVKRLRRPVWTEGKAKLIQSYLRLFVMVTHHGTYIDGFAGPQEPEKTEMWSARLVLQSEPRWFRNLHFIDLDEAQVARLRQLVKDQPPRTRKEPKRAVHVHHGDCNVEIPKLLSLRTISEKEATFCLLDQRTFECRWSTVKALAEYKQAGHKIEQFYFLANKWLPKSIAALTKNPSTAAEWWGRDDWKALQSINGYERAEIFSKRFMEELGYASAKAWPINERRAGGGSVMYFMIHATDHPEAPKLMRRAFEKAVDPTKPVEQLELARLG
jgi:three-Cys-motif partner protein